jgi:hypothetical protein
MSLDGMELIVNWMAAKCFFFFQNLNLFLFEIILFNNFASF